MSASKPLFRIAGIRVIGPARVQAQLGGRRQEDRQQPRLKVFEPCALSVDQSEKRAHILNISEIGALLHATSLHPRNARICLIVRDELLAAKVVWASKQRIGVAFELPPSKRLLATLLG